MSHRHHHQVASRTSCARTPASTATPSASASSAGCSSSRSSTTATRSGAARDEPTSRRSRRGSAGALGRGRGRASPATRCSTSSTTTCSRRSRSSPTRRGKTRRSRRVVRSVFEDAYNYMKSGHAAAAGRQQDQRDRLQPLERPAPVRRHLRADPKDLQSAGNAGEYYTPRAVTQFMVDRDDAPQLGETVLDPACGTGGFLTCAIEHVRRQLRPDARQDERVLQASSAASRRSRCRTCSARPTCCCTASTCRRNVRHDNTLARPLRDYGPRTAWTSSSPTRRSAGRRKTGSRTTSRRSSGRARRPTCSSC